MASIAAVPRPKAILAVIAVAASLAVAGCGGDNEGDLPPDDAATLLSQLEEVEANIDVGSCFVAADEADILIAEVQDLPSDIDTDLREALERGSEQLRALTEDPDQCERPTTIETTTEETTTEETATEEDTTTRETTTEPTTTTTPTTPTTADHAGLRRRRPGRERAGGPVSPRTPKGELISDRYRIEDRLGSGGMSSVFRATDTILERTVAVKILAEHLSDDERFVARFRREALAVAKLVHPNIVQVYDTGSTAGATTSSWSTSAASRGRSCSRPRASSIRPPRWTSASRRAPASTTPTATGSSTATSSRAT